MADKTKPNLITFQSRNFTPRFEYGDQAEVAEVTNHTLDTELGTGFVRFKDADIPWTVQYDEVVLVLDGTIKIVVNDDVLILNVNDTAWLPKNTALRYLAKDALVFYSIHPSNWNAGAS